MTLAVKVALNPNTTNPIICKTTIGPQHENESKNAILVCGRVEDIVEKWENDNYQHFLLFQS